MACSVPVALVFVATGTDHEVAARAFYERLSAFHARLAWFEDPEAHSAWQL